MGGMTDIPKRFPLAVSPENRDNTFTKDAQLVNGYLEKKNDGTYSVYKRAGTLKSTQYSMPAGNGRGLYNWQGTLYAVVGGKLYGYNGLVMTLIGTLHTGFYSFSENQGATPKLILGNGISAYSYSVSSGLLLMSGSQPPGAINPFVSGWAYLDGTTYYADVLNNIYGSGINDITTWDPTNVLKAQIEPDLNIAIAKHLVYIVVFKQWTTEIFYDAGNAAGSPLGPIEGAKINYGCINAQTVKEIDGDLYWVGGTQNGALQILMLHDLHESVISTTYVEKLIQFASFATCYSWSFKGGGHSFYVVTDPNFNITLAYDIKEKVWQRWTDANGNYLPYSASIQVGTLCYVLHETNGTLYEMSTAFASDDGTVIAWDLYTPNVDFGINRRKTLGMLSFNGDKTPGNILQVRHNDDDYAADKWTNFISVDMGRTRPYITHEGTFYKRAYHLRQRTNYPLRIDSLDMQIDLGIL